MCVRALDPHNKLNIIHPDKINHPLGICMFCGIYMHPYTCPTTARIVWSAFKNRSHKANCIYAHDSDVEIITDDIDWIKKLTSISSPPQRGTGGGKKGGTGGNGGTGGAGGSGYPGIIERLPMNVKEIYLSGVLNIPDYALTSIPGGRFGDRITSYVDRRFMMKTMPEEKGIKFHGGVHLFQFKPENWNAKYLFGSIYDKINGMHCYINFKLRFEDKKGVLLSSIVNQCMVDHNPVELVAACADYQIAKDLYIDPIKGVCRITYEGIIYSAKQICSCPGSM